MKLADPAKRILFRFWSHEPFRFLVYGGANSLTTLLLMQALLLVAPFRAAYILAYAAGVMFVMFIYPHFVFRQQTMIKNASIAFAVYASTMIFTLLLTPTVLSLGISYRWAAILVCAFSVCLNYVSMKFALKIANKRSN